MLDVLEKLDSEIGISGEVGFDIEYETYYMKVYNENNETIEYVDGFDTLQEAIDECKWWIANEENEDAMENMFEPDEEI